MLPHNRGDRYAKNQWYSALVEAMWVDIATVFVDINTTTDFVHDF